MSEKKKLIEKIRVWLIKRLGGYTEERPIFPMDKPFVVEHCEVPLFEKSVVVSVPDYGDESNEMIYKRAATRIAFNIAEGMIESNLIAIKEITTGGEKRGPFWRTFKGTVRVAAVKESSATHVIDFGAGGKEADRFYGKIEQTGPYE